jgi:SHS2 domain-containing protein
MTFRYLEHTADVGVEVVAPTLGQAFTEAALALFGIMTDTSAFGPKKQIEIQVSGEDLKSLLYSWLEELIYVFDTTSLVVVGVDIESISSEPHTIAATVCGEKFDPEVHETRTGVKAITYHGMIVVEKEGEFLLRYFVDI